MFDPPLRICRVLEPQMRKLFNEKKFAKDAKKRLTTEVAESTEGRGTADLRRWAQILLWGMDSRNLSRRCAVRSIAKHDNP